MDSVKEYLSALRAGKFLEFAGLADFLNQRWLPKNSSSDDLTPLCVHALLNAGVVKEDLKHFAMLLAFNEDVEVSSFLALETRYSLVALNASLLRVLTLLESKQDVHFRKDCSSMQEVHELFQGQVLSLAQQGEKDKCQMRLFEQATSDSMREGYDLIRRPILDFLVLNGALSQHEKNMRELQFNQDKETQPRLDDLDAFLMRHRKEVSLSPRFCEELKALLVRWCRDPKLKPFEQEFCETLFNLYPHALGTLPLDLQSAKLVDSLLKGQVRLFFSNSVNLLTTLVGPNVDSSQDAQTLTKPQLEK